MMMVVALSVASQQPVNYVNPMIGTDGMGHTFPGACVPFGIIQLSPDTDTIPHNVNGKYQKMCMNIVLVINIMIKRLLVLVIHI